MPLPGVVAVLPDPTALGPSGPHNHLGLGPSVVLGAPVVPGDAGAVGSPPSLHPHARQRASLWLSPRPWWAVAVPVLVAPQRLSDGPVGAGMDFHKELHRIEAKEGLRGRKLQKALESFAWNITVLKVRGKGCAAPTLPPPPCLLRGCSMRAGHGTGPFRGVLAPSEPPSGGVAGGAAHAVHMGPASPRGVAVGKPLMPRPHAGPG